MYVQTFNALTCLLELGLFAARIKRVSQTEGAGAGYRVRGMGGGGQPRRG